MIFARARAHQPPDMAQLNVYRVGRRTDRARDGRGENLSHTSHNRLSKTETKRPQTKNNDKLKERACRQLRDMLLQAPRLRQSSFHPGWFLCSFTGGGPDRRHRHPPPSTESFYRPSLDRSDLPASITRLEHVRLSRSIVTPSSLSPRLVVTEEDLSYLVLYRCTACTEFNVCPAIC